MTRRASVLVLFVVVLIATPKGILWAQPTDSHDQAVDRAQGHPHGTGHEGEAAHGSANPIVWATDLALWTLIVFVVLLFVLRKFAWGPLTSALDAREASIRKSIEDADNARLEAQRLLDEHQKKLDAVKDEVRAILDEARRDAQHTSQQIQREAQEEARAIRDRSRREIEQARDQALKEIYDHLTGLVTMTAGRVLRRELNPADHQRLVEEALAEFSGQSAS